MHPILIAGAVLVGLPVLLHLIMKQEPKRLPFPALRFLKIKQRTNQRKMRLRHFLLLLLRMLIIALFCLTLFQPVLPNQGLLNISGEQPIAAVFVIDTTPSMGYVAGDHSRLEDARQRALTLLDDLPTGSKVAVVDPSDPTSSWEPSVGDARRRIESLKEPKGGGPPVTSGLVIAYQLLRKIEDEADAEGVKFPRLVAVFSDRAAASWDASRNDDLIKLRDSVPQPPVSHLFADVGVEQPTNVAILNIEMRPQVVPQNQPATLTVTVQASGTDVASAAVICRLDGTGTPEKKEFPNLKAGSPKAENFTFRDLKPGFHQVEVLLETRDALMADNVRYATFRVGESRKILTISDDPDEDAFYWKLAHQAKGEFGCDVKKPTDVKDEDLAGYETVCLLNVADPTSLWGKLTAYVNRGGKLLIMPGPTVSKDGYGSAEALALMPGTLGPRLTAPADKPAGVPWVLDEKALKKPFLAPFRDWMLRGNVDFLKSPRLASRYYGVEAPSENVVVSYDDDADPLKRHPAIVERTLKGGGKVVLLTVRMDPMPAQDEWHNYWKTTESSWPVVFPNLLIRYLAGDSADANFNHLTGQAVALPLPKGVAGKTPKVVLEGPGVSGPDATPTLGETQSELRLSPLRTLTAGNYVLRTEDGSWREAFSLNAPVDESNLEKVPPAAIEAVFGPDKIVPAGKDLPFRDMLDKTFSPPLDLFPWLLIAVLLLIAGEGVLANRFYRVRSRLANPDR